MAETTEAVINYEASDTGLAWRERQAAMAQANAALFDTYAGAEASVFADAMGLVHRCFGEDVSSKLSRLGQSVALGILSQAYQQLVSCWEDTRQGRQASATNHWRSIWEALEYAIAAAVNDDFAKEWADPTRRKTLEVSRARRIVKKWFDDEKPGLGAGWASDRMQEQPNLQPYSHVSSVAAGQAGFRPAPQAKGSSVLANGAYSRRSRLTAINTADLARRLCAAAHVAFQEILPDWWEVRFVRVFDEGQNVLNAEFEALRPKAATEGQEASEA